MEVGTGEIGVLKVCVPQLCTFKIGVINERLPDVGVMKRGILEIRKKEGRALKSSKP